MRDRGPGVYLRLKVERPARSVAGNENLLQFDHEVVEPRVLAFRGLSARNGIELVLPQFAVGDIKGESTEKSHRDWISILQWW